MNCAGFGPDSAGSGLFSEKGANILHFGPVHSHLAGAGIVSCLSDAEQPVVPVVM